MVAYGSGRILLQGVLCWAGGQSGSCDFRGLQGMAPLPSDLATYMHTVTNDIDSQRASSPDSRTLDLSGVQITVTSAIILSDVFTIEWGLRKLILKECDLDEHVSTPSHTPFRV